jgi:hypothetical protein
MSTRRVCTPALWPENVRIHSREVRSQSLIVWSSEQEKSIVPGSMDGGAGVVVEDVERDALLRNGVDCVE